MADVTTFIGQSNVWFEKRAELSDGSPGRTIKAKSMPRSNHRDRRKVENARSHADMHNTRDPGVDFRGVCECDSFNEGLSGVKGIGKRQKTNMQA